MLKPSHSEPRTGAEPLPSWPSPDTQSRRLWLNKLRLLRKRPLRATGGSRVNPTVYLVDSLPSDTISAAFLQYPIVSSLIAGIGLFCSSS